MVQTAKEMGLKKIVSRLRGKWWLLFQFTEMKFLMLLNMKRCSDVHMHIAFRCENKG
jgi:hypothetical protein